MSAGQVSVTQQHLLTSQVCGWASGNAAAPQLFNSRWAPRYFNSLYIHLGCYACFIGMALLTRQILSTRNSKKIAAAEAKELVEGRGLANLHAFEDLTDIQVSSLGCGEVAADNLEPRLPLLPLTAVGSGEDEKVGRGRCSRLLWQQILSRMLRLKLIKALCTATGMWWLQVELTAPSSRSAQVL